MALIAGCGYCRCVPRADMASYDKLTLGGKIEAFEWAQNNTAGNDLKR